MSYDTPFLSHPFLKLSVPWTASPTGPKYAWATRLYNWIFSDNIFAPSSFHGTYAYQRLPMGINIAPDVFQEKMQALFDDMSFTVKVYLDDLIIITNGSFDNHLTELRKVFHCLRDKQLQFHTDKSSFCALEAENLGFVLTPDGNKPQPKKVQAIQAILNIAQPTNVHQFRSFLGASLQTVDSSPLTPQHSLDQPYKERCQI